MPAAGLALQAVIAGEHGEQEQSEDYFLRAIEAVDPDFDILCLSGDLARHFGFLEIAAKAFDRAIEIAPHASHALLRRGQTFSEAGDVSAAIDDLLRATLLQPDLCAAHVALGDEYRSANMTDAACKCYHTALEIDPQNTSAHSGLDHTLALVLPQWHSAMLNDTNRNDAFEAAIKAAVTASSTVLDIGTGTGLLAMMASRAGAAKVTGCESVGVLAQTATKNVNQNEFQDRVSIIHKRSQDLQAMQGVGCAKLMSQSFPAMQRYTRFPLKAKKSPASVALISQTVLIFLFSTTCAPTCIYRPTCRNITGKYCVIRPGSLNLISPRIFPQRKIRVFG
jgi:tetratricopeptide (TPR) repeat protein